jgi:hypothetical protein
MSATDALSPMLPILPRSRQTGSVSTIIPPQRKKPLGIGVEILGFDLHVPSCHPGDFNRRPVLPHHRLASAIPHPSLGANCGTRPYAARDVHELAPTAAPQIREGLTCPKTQTPTA